jgi:phosphoglycerate dehydrogenase-like enzyme
VRILFAGSGWRSFVDHVARRLPGHEVAVWTRRESLAQVVAQGVDVLLPSNAPVDAAVIAAGGDLRLIQQPAAGAENIDVAAARGRGIPVCNAPGANPVSVAEAALLLMLALARRLPRARAAFAAGTIGEPPGIELAGRTLGIVGRGKSGEALAAVAAGIGMQVVSVDSRRSEAEWRALLAAADVVSLHCPLTAATRGLLDDAAFAAMKPGALVVNCARGAVIDRGALERALASGRLGGAGLDVFWDEPWDPADPLYARPDVVVLPHVAGSTEEAFARVADIVGENVERLARGEPLLHQVS